MTHSFPTRRSSDLTVALGGPSGAGKSTVFQMLLRFFDPQSGSVKVDGHDVRRLEPADLRSRIALVPQDPVIFGADAMENLRYGRLDASDADGYIGREACRDRVCQYVQNWVGTVELKNKKK